MIRVVQGRPQDHVTEAALRPVNAALDGTTGPSRRLETDAGQALAALLAGLGELPTGAAVITPAGDSPFDLLIHAVVQGPDEPVTEPIVRTALLNGLRRAQEWGLASLTLLPLGTGAGNLDDDEAARVTADVLQEHLGTVDTLEEIVIVVSSDYQTEAFRAHLVRAFGEDGVAK